MSVIGIVLLVAFVIICLLLVALVLLQNDEGDGMGGLFGGSGTQAFGARSGNVLTKTTYVLVTLFFVASFALAFLNKAPTVKSIDDTVKQEQEASGNAEWWNESAEAVAE